MSEFRHHPTCRSDYPEKPEGEDPHLIVEIKLDDDDVVLQCADCGAFSIRSSVVGESK